MNQRNMERYLEDPTAVQLHLAEIGNDAFERFRPDESDPVIID